MHLECFPCAFLRLMLFFWNVVESLGVDYDDIRIGVVRGCATQAVFDDKVLDDIY